MCKLLYIEQCVKITEFVPNLLLFNDHLVTVNFVFNDYSRIIIPRYHFLDKEYCYIMMIHFWTFDLRDLD
jgi:hypothetical protein